MKRIELVYAGVTLGALGFAGALPFLSHGGTSLVMSCAVLGVLLGVGRRAASPPRGRPA